MTTYYIPDWGRCEAITGLPLVHEALTIYYEDPCSDNATALVRTILQHEDQQRQPSALGKPVAEWVNEEQGFQYLVKSRLPDGTMLYTKGVMP